MKYPFWILPLALVGGLIGCTARMPLDAVITPIPINGQITVNVLDGASPTAGVAINCISPGGGTQSQSSTSTATALGQVIFKESYTGQYKIMVANQPANTPNFVMVGLTTANPYATISLQVGNGYIQVSSGDGGPLSYDETAAFHTFKLTYVNNTNLQQDATIVYNPEQTALPPGWTVIFNTAQVTAGQSTDLIVETSPYTIFGNVSVIVTALVNSHSVIVAPLVLTQRWAPGIQWTVNTDPCLWFNLNANFYCFHCTNPDDTDNVSVNITNGSYTGGFGGTAPGCNSTAGGTLTDALTAPDGQGPQLMYNIYCSPTNIGRDINITSQFVSGIGAPRYTFTPPVGCDSVSGYTTITASMLQ